MYNALLFYIYTIKKNSWQCPICVGSQIDTDRLFTPVVNMQNHWR